MPHLNRQLQSQSQNTRVDVYHCQNKTKQNLLISIQIFILKHGHFRTTSRHWTLAVVLRKMKAETKANLNKTITLKSQNNGQ